MTTIPERIAAARATGSKAIAVEIEQVERWMEAEKELKDLRGNYKMLQAGWNYLVRR